MRRLINPVSDNGTWSPWHDSVAGCPSPPNRPSTADRALETHLTAHSKAAGNGGEQFLFENVLIFKNINESAGRNLKSSINTAKSWLPDCTGKGSKLKKLPGVEKKQHVLVWNGKRKMTLERSHRYNPDSPQQHQHLHFHESGV